jgi:hypothetical protein
MPVILENGSDEIKTWLDPNKTTWSKELQSLLKPYKGELEVYPVPKEVGKVGNNSQTFVIPLSSSQNKSNIANFFSKGAAKDESKSAIGTNFGTSTATPGKVEEEKDSSSHIKLEKAEEPTSRKHRITEGSALSPATESDAKHGIKRGLEDETVDQTPAKISKTSTSPNKALSSSKVKTRSATSNNNGSPKKPSVSKGKGSQRITSFFAK